MFANMAEEANQYPERNELNRIKESGDVKKTFRYTQENILNAKLRMNNIRGGDDLRFHIPAVLFGY